MTVLTVKAQDTATAMEEIVEKLGKDSFIIGTKKIGNEILVKATNSPKKTIHPKQNLNKTFNKIISKELNQSSVSSLANSDWTYAKARLLFTLKPYPPDVTTPTILLLWYTGSFPLASASLTSISR